MEHAGFPMPQILVVAVFAGMPAEIAAACRVMPIRMETCSQLFEQAVEKPDVAVGASMSAKIFAACRVAALCRADALCRVAVACRTMPMHMDTFPQSSGLAVEKPDVAVVARMPAKVAGAYRAMPMHMYTIPQSSVEAVEKPDVASLGSRLLGTACWNLELENMAG